MPRTLTDVPDAVAFHSIAAENSEKPCQHANLDSVNPEIKLRA